MRLFKHEQQKVIEPPAVAPTDGVATPEQGTVVLQAELPGVDPAKDLEVTVADGMLFIEAEHEEEKTSDDDGFVRHELVRWSFGRTVPLPAGAVATDITASYKDGVLEIRMPAGEPAPPTPATKVPITTS